MHCSHSLLDKLWGSHLAFHLQPQLQDQRSWPEHPWDMDRPWWVWPTIEMCGDWLLHNVTDACGHCYTSAARGTGQPPFPAFVHSVAWPSAASDHVNVQGPHRHVWDWDRSWAGFHRYQWAPPELRPGLQREQSTGWREGHDKTMENQLVRAVWPKGWLVKLLFKIKLIFKCQSIFKVQIRLRI